jgi:ribokinase
MAEILVSGLINLETTLRIEGFPIAYSPVTYPVFGVQSAVAGVGYNIAKALITLGDQPHLVSLIGRDPIAPLVRQQLAADGIAGEFVLAEAEQTAQSVILYDGEGRRQIHTDPKDVRERAYPVAEFERALAPCSVAALCNINFSRPFLQKAREAGKLVATDVHAIASLDDEYNADFMRASQVLFMSDENLPCAPEEWAEAVQAKYGNAIVVIGLGDRGALLSVKADAATTRLPAAHVRPVVNTVGAGDALFAAFLHYYGKSRNPYAALRRAVVFAGYKVGAATASDGFLNAAAVERIIGNA